MKTYHFKSIQVSSVEDIKSGTYTMEFQPDSVQDHSIDISFGDIIGNRSWITGFFISLMSNAAFFAIMYAGIVIGYGFDFSSPRGSGLRFGFIAAFILFFTSIMILYSVPGAVKNLKKDAVHAERGRGTWKIIDEKKWPAFKRLLDIKGAEK